MKSILLPFALELMASYTFAQEHPLQPLWKELQKAETMLVQTGRTLHRAEAAEVFEGRSYQFANHIQRAKRSPRRNERIY